MTRRFLHLLVRRTTPWGSPWGGRGEYALRRIDMSRFFPPRKPSGGEDGSAAAGRPRPAAAAMVDAQLPRAGEVIYRPQGRGWGMRCDGLGKGGATVLGGGMDKVVGEDGEHRSFLLILYKCGAHAVRVLPGMRAPKQSPIAFTVGDGVYVLEAAPEPPPPLRGAQSHLHCFEALVHGIPPPRRYGASTSTSIEDWHWRSLPAPPYVLDPGDDGPACVAAHAVVGDTHIWVSTERHGTYSFDTASGAWSKAGDWALPFRGRAEHVPEHNLWFGFSPNDDGHLCASDLTTTPPLLRRTWRYRASPPHKDWPAPVASYLVPLGAGRLCVAELFETTRVEVGGQPLDDKKKNKASKTTTTTRRWGFNAAADEEEDEEETEVTERFAVVTGVEVEASGKALRMAKLAVRRYALSTQTIVTRQAKRGNTTVRGRSRGRPKKDHDMTLHWVF